MRTAIAALILACSAGAQANHKLEFEVASIHVAPPPDGHGIRVTNHGGPGTGDPTRFVGENVTIFQLIYRAYDIKDYQIDYSGDAKSVPRYNISAKIPAGATKDEFRVMLQNLLADRFRLKFHRETRTVPIFRLVIAKGGAKLKDSAGEPNMDVVPSGPRVDKDGYPNAPPGAMAITAVNGVVRGRFNAVNESMAELAGNISLHADEQVDRPVVDATGLTGKYDFVLSWYPSPEGAAPPDGPTLMAALQEQLGLKLEAAKGPIEMFVIESFEKTPSEN